MWSPGCALLSAALSWAEVPTLTVRSGAGGSSVAPRPKPGRTTTAPAVASSSEPKARRPNGSVGTIAVIVVASSPPGPRGAGRFPGTYQGDVHSILFFAVRRPRG